MSVCVLLPAQVQHPPVTKTGLEGSGGLRKEKNPPESQSLSPSGIG